MVSTHIFVGAVALYSIQTVGSLSGREQEMAITVLNSEVLINTTKLTRPAIKPLQQRKFTAKTLIEI